MAPHRVCKPAVRLQLAYHAYVTDAVAELLTEYTYDVELDAEEMDYPTHNNRLLYYTVSDTTGQKPVLLRTVQCTYYDTLDPTLRRKGQAGNASNPFGRLRAGITIKDEYVEAQTTPGDPADFDWHNDLVVTYEGRRHSLHLAVSGGRGPLLVTFATSQQHAKGEVEIQSMAILAAHVGDAA